MDNNVEDLASPVSETFAAGMQELESLLELRTRTQSLLRVKATLLQTSDQLEKKEHILEEMISEKQCLLKEKKMLLNILRAVQQDLDMVNESVQSLTMERDGLTEKLTKVREEEYNPLKDEVDSLRSVHGLGRLPNFQEELDAQMARYLEERRKQWRDHDSEGASMSPSPGPGVGTSSSAGGPNSRRRSAPVGGGRTKKKR